MIEPIEIDQMVARIVQGDAAAAAALHERFSARVYFVALREMRSRADAEDVRNETMVRVLQAIRGGRLAESAALPGFVVATARNVIREFGRQGRRAEPIEERDFAAPAETPVVDHTVKRVIDMVLRRLKPREQTFLRLYYYDELSKPEICRRLGIPEERLRLIKSRALKSFGEMYGRFVK